eukprot:2215907-Prymnesium_polylepis.1
MYGADGVDRPCSVIGDSPVVYLDSAGERRRTTICNVRCVPEFTCSMLSVAHLWEDSGVDTIFRNTRCFVVPTPGEKHSDYIPFDRGTDGLFRWEIAAVGRSFSKLRSIPASGVDSSASLVAPAAIRGANSHSHVNILSADDAGV